MEQDVVFRSDGVALAGTITRPAGEGPLPAVLFIAGSGQVDRNENAARMPINIFGQLAGHLAAAGFASLRCDKRGVGKSEGDFWRTGFYDNVADAAAALRFLRTQSFVDRRRVFLIGHSEGAFIAGRVAAELGDAREGDAAAPAGVILLSGGAVPLETVLKWQAKKIAETQSALNRRILRSLHLDVEKMQAKQLRKVRESEGDVMRVQLLARVNAKWLREALDYDPAPDLRRLRVPVLAMTGAKDVQVDPEDLGRMAQVVSAPFESHLLSDVTHLLRRSQEPPGLRYYRRQVTQPLDAELVELLVEWLARQSRGMGDASPVPDLL